MTKPKAYATPLANPGKPTRPIRLRKHPERIWIETLEGTPIEFSWRGQRFPLTQAIGPERIETGWWRGQDIRRDYYQVETAAGERFWLYRDLAREGWYLHG